MEDWAIGIDLGGTKIEAALVNTKGNIISRQRISTDANIGYDAILTHIINIVNTICDQNKDKQVVAIGMGVAGQIEKNSGVVKYAPNLEWRNVSLGADLSKKLNKPVTICNDVRAATIGEWLFGAGKGCDDLVCIFIGTGIGSGIVSSGKLLEGINNTAGEIGHITIDVHGPQCHCGNTGCFEALAGGWAIARDIKKAVSDNKEAGKTLLNIANGDINQLSAKTLEEGIKQNDFISTQLINNLAEYLIAGGVSVVNAFGPKRFIWGGGIIEGMPQLLPVIEKGIKKRALPAATDSLEIVPTQLHNDSGVIGAAAYALQTLKKI
jgi:glucokinase